MRTDPRGAQSHRPPWVTALLVGALLGGATRFAITHPPSDGGTRVLVPMRVILGGQQPDGLRVASAEAQRARAQAAAGASVWPPRAVPPPHGAPLGDEGVFRRVRADAPLAQAWVQPESAGDGVATVWAFDRAGLELRPFGAGRDRGAVAAWLVHAPPPDVARTGLTAPGTPPTAPSDRLDHGHRARAPGDRTVAACLHADGAGWIVEAARAAPRRVQRWLSAAGCTGPIAVWRVPAAGGAVRVGTPPADADPETWVIATPL